MFYKGNYIEFEGSSSLTIKKKEFQYIPTVDTSPTTKQGQQKYVFFPSPVSPLHTHEKHLKLPHGARFPKSKFDHHAVYEEAEYKLLAPTSQGIQNL